MQDKVYLVIVKQALILWGPLLVENNCFVIGESEDVSEERSDSDDDEKVKSEDDEDDDAEDDDSEGDESGDGEESEESGDEDDDEKSVTSTQPEFQR